MEDRSAILELEGHYARSFDDRDGATWSSLFTPDRIHRSRDVGQELSTGTSVQGRKSLHAFCEDAPFTGIHPMHLPQTTLVGNRTPSRVHMEWFGSFVTPGSPSQRLVGYYDIEYARAGSTATWQISDRVTTTSMSEPRTLLGYVPGSGPGRAGTRRM
ncbi:nuclear transport factor 2 family protein [Prescottella sp. R16]|uniref:nuclear transport factor 2 family protein n=1 Tax=Prescottella sp. R16 TaxID=3064529 RepID=UPI00272E7B68|nr:nuclear transport factor 2 family protein [Prescottella sp. R16]